MQVKVSANKAMYYNRLINSIFLTQMFLRSVLRQVHRPLQSEFSREGELELSPSDSSIFSLSLSLSL